MLGSTFVDLIDETKWDVPEPFPPGHHTGVPAVPLAVNGVEGTHYFYEYICYSDHSIEFM